MKIVIDELCKIRKIERKLEQNAEKGDKKNIVDKIEDLIPDKVESGLEKVFSKAFNAVFEKGTALISKTYKKEEIEKEFKVNDFAFNMCKGKYEIKRIKKKASNVGNVGAFITAIEGIGLGALGIGLPDIILWLTILLRGVYETAMKYGFDYESYEERMFILKLLETAVLEGEKWRTGNLEIDEFITESTHDVPDSEAISKQIELTSEAFADFMLISKFIQGIPIIGMIGGSINPFFYTKIMKYVELKYRKRYLFMKI